MKPEPANLAAARKLVGRRVSKEFAEGLFHGIVKRVDANVAAVTGEPPRWPFLFFVKYEDDDDEHLTWEELQPILQPAAGQHQQQQRPGKPDKSAREPVPANGHQHLPQQQNGAKRGRPHQGMNGNAAAAAAAAAGLASPRSAKRQRKQTAPQYLQHGVDDDAGDVGGEDEEELAGAGLAAVGRAAKRCREGDPAQQAPDDENMEDDGDQGDSDEGDRDAGDMEDQSEDGPLDDMPFTQHDTSRIPVRCKGLPGHLHSIKLQNFMCHENFEMTFGTHVNFVSGTNGSGKSAVLQGLQCCLGATAKSTGRAASLAHFIRTGADMAKVQVTLWNTGEDAHLPGILGETVTIERRISRGNNTAWKVYDARMRPVPSLSNRGSINSVLDTFSVNASNPLAVLSQDTARTFLGGGNSDKRKFDLFMEATMLSNFKSKLSRAAVYVNKMRDGIKQTRDEYNERRLVLKQLAEKLQKLKDANQLLSQRANMERAVLWMGVEERADVLAAIRNKLEVSLPKRKAPYEQGLAQVEHDLEELREQEQQKVARQLEVNRSYAEFADEVAQLAAAVKAARKALQTAKSKYQDQKREVEDVKVRLDSHVQAQMESNDDSKRELAERLAHNQSQVDQETQRRDALAQEVAAKQDELNEAQQRVQELTGERPKLISRLETLRQSVQRYQEEKRRLYAASKDNIQLFGGAPVSQLVAAVKSNMRRFSKPPLGPIGAHLALADPKWAKAVEHALGQQLDKWIVHNHQDEQLLRSLARNCGCRSLTVLVYSYDYPRYVVPPPGRLDSSLTLLQEVMQLRVEQPELEHVLWNQLLDKGNIARVVLAEDDEAARTPIYNPQGQQMAVSASYSITGLKYHRARSTVVSTQFNDRRPRLGANVSANLAELDRLIAEAQGNIASVEQELAQLDYGLNTARAAVTSLMDAMRGKAREKATVEGSLRMLATQAQDMAAEQAEVAGEDVAGVIAGLQQELTSSQMQLDQLEGELQEATQADASARSLHQEKGKEVNLVTDELDAINGAVERIADQKKGAQDAAKALTDALAKLAAEEAQLKKEQADAEAELARCRADAEAVCMEYEGKEAVQAVRALITERVGAQLDKQLERQRKAGNAQATMSEAQRRAAVEGEVCRRMMPEELFKELERVEKAISSAEGEAGGSKEDLVLEHSKVQAEVTTRGSIFQNLRSAYNRIAQFLHDREKAYEDLFKNVAKAVNEKFYMHMSRRQHYGRVNINEDAGELKLLVMVNGATGNQRAVKDLKQLSGGERSFTTVAFILALGEWTESPFRAMDEYDVFMDAINRRTATETLLQFAIDNDEYQMIFLTPQERASLMPSSGVTFVDDCMI